MECRPLLFPVLSPDPDSGPDGHGGEGLRARSSDVQAHGGLGEGMALHGVIGAPRERARARVLRGKMAVEDTPCHVHGTAVEALE